MHPKGEIIVKVIPCGSCDPGKSLPSLKKDMFKGTADVKIAKVQKFIVKRLLGLIQIEQDDIEVLYLSKVLKPAQYLKDFMDFVTLENPQLNLSYRRK
jgi:hypothetical protein